MTRKLQIDFASALLHSNLHFCLKRYAKPLTPDQLPRTFSVNVIRATSGDGTIESPTVYGRVTAVHGEFMANETSRRKFTIALTFNRCNGDRDAVPGSHPKRLKIPGYALDFVQSAVAFQAVTQFLEQKGLIQLDFSEMQSRLARPRQEYGYGVRAVEAFNVINERSLQLLAAHGVSVC